MNEKKYQSPMDTQATEAVFEAAKQWCDNDTSSKRGAIVMLTDEKGTHYMYVGNKDANIKGVYDLMTSTDFGKAGRAVQITFEIASFIVHIDKEAKEAGIDPTKAKNFMEREAMFQQVPEYNEMMQLIQRLNEELRAIWQEK